MNNNAEHSFHRVVLFFRRLSLSASSSRQLTAAWFSFVLVRENRGLTLPQCPPIILAKTCTIRKQRRGKSPHQRVDLGDVA